MNPDDFRERFKAELSESKGAYCAGWAAAETVLELLADAREIFDRQSSWTPNQEGLPDPAWQFSRGFVDALARAFPRTIDRVTFLACSRHFSFGRKKGPEIIRKLVREELLSEIRDLNERRAETRGPVDFDPWSDEW